MLTKVQTPLIRLSNLFPSRQVHGKCEFLAPSGCFKIHGATHLLERLSRQGNIRKLVVPSMGNTALGLAAAVKSYGFTMTGVVPQSIGRDKDQKLQALGVELVKVPGDCAELLGTATRVAAERAAYFVHPHLDPLWTDGYHVIAEQILSALPDCRSLVFPVGGGGLLMGLTSYFSHHPAAVKLIGCEAYNAPTYAYFTHARSATIADGLILDDAHPQVLLRIDEHGIPIAMVREDDIRTAMAALYQCHGLVVEPSSAVTVAYVMTHLADLEDPTCVILTGGNIASVDFDRLIRAEEYGT
jgi:threonine dehydratase